MHSCLPQYTKPFHTTLADVHVPGTVVSVLNTTERILGLEICFVVLPLHILEYRFCINMGEYTHG